MIFWVMDRWGEQKDCIGDVQEAIHKDELNGEDSLTLVLPERRLAKGDRVVWRDKWGEWHEHIVNEVTSVHADGSLYFSAYCENSIAETFLDYIDEAVYEDVAASVALSGILARSRWEAGAVDDLGTGSLYCFQSSVHEGVGKVLETWGGEYSTRVEVDGEGVSARRLDVKASRGHDDGKLFTYGHDMASVTQTVSADDVVTRLHVFGKPTGYGDSEAGYTERLTFAVVNGGKDYVEDDDAKLRWGVPDGRGGVKHAEGVAVFDECDDEDELLELGRAELDSRKHPHVTYEATLAVLADYGYDYEDVRTGDTVALRDKPLDLRLEGRVVSVTRYLVNTAATELVMGDSVRSITDVVKQQGADLAWLKARSLSWNGASDLSEAYLNRVIDSLNEQMNATGGYAYWEQGIGITVYDRPREQNPTMAIQLNGMGLRIANSKQSNGEWAWRTFGTGDGFAADEIITGAIHCGQNVIDLTNGTVTLKDGLIQDADGKNYWNLATGILKTMRGYIGGFTIGGSALYSGPSSLSGRERGVYLGTDGLSTSDGVARVELAGGCLSGYVNGELSGFIRPAARTYGDEASPAGLEISSEDHLGIAASGIYVDGGDETGYGETASRELLALSPAGSDPHASWEGFDESGDDPVRLAPRWSYSDTVLGIAVRDPSRQGMSDGTARSFYTAAQVARMLKEKASSSDVSGLRSALDGKAASGHTHAYSDITGAPSLSLNGKRLNGVSMALEGTVLTITTS